MGRLYRCIARVVRGITLAVAFAALCGFPPAGSPFAHEGHDHAVETKAGPSVASPRVVATSENYQFVGIVDGEVLVIYLDRAADNSPVTTATMEVTLDGELLKAELQEKTGAYEITAALLRRAGSYEVLVNLSEVNTSDLLVGTLTIPQASAGRKVARTASVSYQRCFGELVARQDRRLNCWDRSHCWGRRCGCAFQASQAHMVPAAILAMILLSGLSFAHEGHDHGRTSAPARAMPRLAVPTAAYSCPSPRSGFSRFERGVVTIETKMRTVRFSGRRCQPQPKRRRPKHHSGEKPDRRRRGVPPLGTRVKTGDLLGRVTPSFASVELIRHGPNAGHARPGDRAQSPEARAAGTAARAPTWSREQPLRTSVFSSRASRSAGANCWRPGRAPRICAPQSTG